MYASRVSGPSGQLPIPLPVYWWKLEDSSPRRASANAWITPGVAPASRVGMRKQEKQVLLVLTVVGPNGLGSAFGKSLRVHSPRTNTVRYGGKAVPSSDGSERACWTGKGMMAAPRACGAPAGVRGPAAAARSASENIKTARPHHPAVRPKKPPQGVPIF